MVRTARFAGVAAGVGFAGGLGITLGIFLFSGRFVLALPVAFAIGALIGGFGVGLFGREGVGGLVEFATGGGRGHSRSEYSRAQSLTARGAYRDAVAEYGRAAEDQPDDPQPLILGARVLRDQLRDPVAAADWLRRASRISGLKPADESAIVRELVDLYDGPLGTPARAIPELARIAETHAGTRTGEWAGRRLAALRLRAWENVKRDD